MKADKKKKKHLLVQRVTIDEKISGDIMRILISSPAKDVEELKLGEVKWTKEKEKYINSENYADKMGIPVSKRKDFPFAGFHEGQVFLTGNFKIIGKKKSPDKLLLGNSDRKFLAIDTSIKEEIKRLYSKVLEKGEGNV